ncbi:hypothetical protein BJX62DRAFT_175179 [Aspergillus germanicus]
MAKCCCVASWLVCVVDRSDNCLAGTYTPPCAGRAARWFRQGKDGETRESRRTVYRWLSRKYTKTSVTWSASVCDRCTEYTKVSAVCIPVNLNLHRDLRRESFPSSGAAAEVKLKSKMMVLDLRTITVFLELIFAPSRRGPARSSFLKSKCRN